MSHPSETQSSGAFPSLGLFCHRQIYMRATRKKLQRNLVRRAPDESRSTKKFIVYVFFDVFGLCLMAIDRHGTLSNHNFTSSNNHDNTSPEHHRCITGASPQHRQSIAKMPTHPQHNTSCSSSCLSTCSSSTTCPCSLEHASGPSRMSPVV